MAARVPWLWMMHIFNVVLKRRQQPKGTFQKKTQAYKVR